MTTTLTTTLSASSRTARRRNQWRVDLIPHVTPPGPGAAPAPGTLTHRAAYETGNGEDGYLTGVDNLISLCERCEATLRG